MKTNYEKNAQSFLDDTKTTLKIELATPQKSPLWVKKGEKHGLNYKVILKNQRASYTFDFWNSIASRELVDAINAIQAYTFNENQEHYQAEKILQKAGINWCLVKSKENKAKEIAKHSPTAYSILACLSPLHEETFEEFCGNFGYDVDSVTALKTFDACREQDRNLRKLFAFEELEKLTEIN